MLITPREYQNDYINFTFACPHLGTLAYHGMGLGKTLSSLWIARRMMADLRDRGVRNPKFMVIIPKSAMITWQVECQKHTPDIYKDMLLLPYSQLNKAGKLVMYYDIRLLVMDESHYVKSPETNRAQDLAALFNFLDTSTGKFHGGKILMLSGTPMLNSAAELYTSWAILASPNIAEASIRLLDEGRYERWGKTFAQQKEKKWETRSGEKKGSSWEGIANADKLQQLMSPVTHYRRVEDCIDLPDKIDIPIDLKLPDDRLLKDANLEEPEAYMALLERLARAKTPHLIEWVKDFLMGNKEQLVVFASYKFPLQELRDRFPKDVVLVTGEETGSERKANIEAFQAGKKRVIALTYRAGSESLNLQNAYFSIYLSYPWTKGGLNQAIARTYRSGQKNLSRHYFLTSGYNDQRILNIVMAKGEATNEFETQLLNAGEKEYSLDLFI